ncbi:hypothetical protein SFRURICE_008821 [Spodoptera frugiperda]|nr:hypothetical protein SFRURICE_008821 [Spodoptera frugiperda]
MQDLWRIMHGGYGCRTEYIYRTRRACLNALRERSSNICSRLPCLRGNCIQTIQDPGFTCKCEGTGFYGQRLPEKVVVGEGPSGSGARGEALVSSGKSHTRAPSRKWSDSESDALPASDASVRRPQLQRSPRTAARGKGKSKGCKRSAATARTKPTERLSESSIMEVTCGEGSEAEHDSVGLRQIIKEELRRVAGKKSQPARNEQMKSAETTIMTAVFKLCGMPSAEKVHTEVAVLRREMVSDWPLHSPPVRARAAPPARAPVPPPVQVEPPPNAPTGHRNKRRGGVTAQQAVGPATVVPISPARDLGGGEWQVVGEARRVAKEGKKRRKKAQRQRRQQQRKEKRAAALLRTPKTAAVVLTLQPDAVQRAVTYDDVLAKLKGAVTPAEFGAPNGFAIKATATGARLLEVPGATSGPSADALAERLRACLGADEVRVSRPTKCLDLRIMGLDDSVTEHEVVAAVARTGGCPADQIKAGTIRPDNSVKVNEKENNLEENKINAVRS